MNLIYPLNVDFLTRLLNLIFRDASFGVRIIRAIDFASMPTEESRRTFEALSLHVREAGSVPDSGVLSQRLFTAYERGAFTKAVYESTLNFIRKSASVRAVPRDDARAVLREAILSVSVGNGLDAALRCYKGREYDNVQRVVDGAFAKARLLDIGPSGRLMSRDLDGYIGDIATGKARVDRIPIGIEPLDTHLKGGLGRGELGCVMAKRKAGKSQFLSHVAQTAVLSGLMCVYLSYELSRKEIENRITAGLIEVPTDNIAWAGDLQERETMSRIVRDRLRGVFADTKGDYYVDGFPSKSMSPRDIGLYLLDVVESIKRPIDVLIIDYADELRTESKHDDLYSKLDSIYGDLRALGAHPDSSYAAKDSFNCAVWTASQVTRSGMDRPTITMGDVDKSIEKISKVDLALSINQDAAEAAMDMARYFVVACRYAPGGREDVDVFGPYATDYAYGRACREEDVSRGITKCQEEKSQSWTNSAQTTGTTALARPISGSSRSLSTGLAGALELRTGQRL